MKKVILILSAVLFSTGIFSQTIEAESLDTLSVEYIQLLPVEKWHGMGGNKVNVVIDYGAPKVAAIMENGKPVVFNSTIHALNLVCKHGWEYVDAYPVVSPVKGYRFLLRKIDY